MKIYTKIVWQWQPDGSLKTVEEESFDYIGPVDECKSAPSAPPAPDYTGAAVATAAGNKEAAIAAQQGSMVNQFTPYGSLQYSPGANTAQGNPTYNANISLDPLAQKTLDTQLQTSNDMGNLGLGAIDRTNAAYSQPMDLSSVGKISDQAYADQTARLDPQWKSNDEAQASLLANQGITQGSEAYNNAMRTYGQAKNDAYTQARQAAIQNMPQTYQLATATREQPLNELNAIRTGAQIQNPQFMNTPQQQTVPGPNYSGATQATGQYNLGQYNSGVGQANSFNSGLFGLGGSGLGAYGTYAGLAAMSDRRLKSDIKRIGVRQDGLNVYSYKIAGIRQIGVMADEVEKVKPHAVLTLSSGYKMVDYGAL